MSASLTENILLHGQPSAPEIPVLLRAGPLHMELADGQLRHIRLGDSRLILRLYPAVRDAFWNTIPGQITEAALEAHPDSFRVVYTSTHRNGDVDFTWKAEITGDAGGTVRFDFRGKAGAAFRKNRIGLCVLHPASLSGAGCEVVHVSGDTAARQFPGTVDPAQPVKGLHDFHILRYAAAQDVVLEMQASGDVFEMEDQRNWTDASFKTYSTPQRIPLPAQMQAGQEIQQTVTLRLTGPGAAMLPPALPFHRPGPVVITAAEGPTIPLPGLGVASAYHGQALSDAEMRRLHNMGLDHLRVDVDVSASGWEAAFQQALHEAAIIKCGVDAALHLPEHGAELQLPRLADLAVASGLQIRWLVLTKGRPSTTAASLGAARQHLQGLIGGGTDADFFQLNNNRPPAELMDFVFVPLRPCAHQFDNATLAENLSGQRYVLDALSAIYPGLPVHVSPVNLRTRAQKGPSPGPGEMPAQADVRQMSLLGAAWTIGCIKAVAESRAGSLTLFQTTGLRGVMSTAEGSAAPRDFHCLAGGVYPVYHAIKAVSSRAGRVVPAHSTDPLRAEAVIMKTRDGFAAIAVNYTPQTVTVALKDASGAPLFRHAASSTLHAGNAAEWMAEPERQPPPASTVSEGVLEIPAFGVTTVEWA